MILYYIITEFNRQINIYFLSVKLTSSVKFNILKLFQLDLHWILVKEQFTNISGTANQWGVCSSIPPPPYGHAKVKLLKSGTRIHIIIDSKSCDLRILSCDQVTRSVIVDSVLQNTMHDTSHTFYPFWG